jgi:hypothetical protein
MKVRYTVPSTVSRAAYSGNGVTVNFSVPFNFFDDSDLYVVLVNNTTAAETVQALTTNYTVTGGEGETGTLTMIVAPIAGVTLVIERNMPYTQEIDLEPNDPFPAEVTEEGFDRGVMLAQQNLLKINKSPKLPPTYDPDSGEIRLPLPENGKLLSGKADETGWENVAISDLALADIPTLITGATDGDILEFDGTNWINGRIDEDNITSGVVVELSGTQRGLRPAGSSTVSADDYSSYVVMQRLPNGRIGALYHRAHNHGSSDPEALRLFATVAGAGSLTMNGNEVSAGEINLTAPSVVRVTTDGSETTFNVEVTGENPVGTPVTDVISLNSVDGSTATNGVAVVGTQEFYKITAIESDAASVGKIAVGLNELPSSIVFKYSDDDGATWSAEVALFDGGTSGLYRYYFNALGVTPKGEFVALCTKVNITTGSTSLVRRASTLSASGSWSAETVATYTMTTPPTTLAPYGQIKNTPSGKMVMVAYSGRYNYVMVSEDECATFTGVVTHDSDATYKSVTSITRASTTATVTATAHGLATGNIINVAGAVETAYNGVKLITVTGVDTFTYTVAGSPSTPATGTIALQLPAVGETALHIRDEKRWLLAYMINGAAYPFLQSTTADGGATWSVAAMPSNDLAGTMTVYGGYVSPALVEFGRTGARKIALLYQVRTASGSYDVPDSIVANYGRVEDVYLGPTRWGPRQLILSGTAVARSGYPSAVESYQDASFLVGYHLETAVAAPSLSRVSDVKTIAVDPARYLSERVGALRFGGDSDELTRYVKEGTWTPVITGSTGGTANTYTNQFGYYTRIGHRVFLDFDLQVDGANNATGNLRVSGLPFTARRSVARAFVRSGDHSAGIYPQLVGTVAGESYLSIEHITSTSFSFVTDAEIGSTGYRVTGTLSYITDDA